MPKDPRTIRDTPAEEIRRIIAENSRLRDKYMSRQELADCPVCEREFLKAAKHQKFCCDGCRGVWFKIRAQLRKTEQVLPE